MTHPPRKKSCHSKTWTDEWILMTFSKIFTKIEFRKKKRGRPDLFACKFSFQIPFTLHSLPLRPGSLFSPFFEKPSDPIPIPFSCRSFLALLWKFRVWVFSSSFLPLSPILSFPLSLPPAIPFRLRPPRCSLFVPGNLASGFPCLSIQTIKF